MRLSDIGYRLPKRNDAERRGYDSLATLLVAAGAEHEDPQHRLAATEPANALPTTTLDTTDAAPHLRFDGIEVDERVGEFALVGDDAAPSTTSTQRETEGPADESPTLSAVAARLSEHVAALDHSGVNIPESTLLATRWNKLIDTFAAECAVYRYPTGAPFPFVIPTTDAEFRDDIERFTAERTARFEVVYDEQATRPALQFAFRSDLTRARAESLFPSGFTIPGLEDAFRCVPVTSPWPEVAVRVDVYYDDVEDDWATGEWLVAEGGRIEP
ncbi:hypothetical protein [Haloprofundus salinisoli]|uniref:hypothetical protein n=1 Tax=Haloprofundus salinisoli TaxID=2876193 RepID=UPI001CCA3AC0|nr:hypothetical protein [Haloprofundus salinisoli]